MQIGDRIKARRIELGLTQDELAKKLGYKSRSTINKIELNINDITQPKIIDFAAALDTTPYVKKTLPIKKPLRHNRRRGHSDDIR